MDAIDFWIRYHVAAWVPQVLLITALVIMAWFPGFNARRRGHDSPRLIASAGWLTVALLLCVLAVDSDAWTLAVIPVWLTLWIGAVTGSYGKRVVLPAAHGARGFEVLTPYAVRQRPEQELCPAGDWAVAID